MLERIVRKTIEENISRQPAVAIIGPRQVGKTTLALAIAESRKSIYLDLEAYQDREKLSDPILFLQQYEDHLVILDEIHRMPELFQTLRGVIDVGRRKGIRTGRFLILGSASMDLLKQSGETLAGRIAYVDMTPFILPEIGVENLNKLWVRGGFPESFLCNSDRESLEYRRHFIRTYLERELMQLGLRTSVELMEKLWMMLAHCQGSMLNASRLAANLDIASKTLNHYVGILVDLLLFRRLRPFYKNIKKRLIKAPKVYIRDSGILHALLGIQDYKTLLGHPVSGMSWEGFVIENILSMVPFGTIASFYRTSAGAEIDLVLEMTSGEIWAIEIKKGVRAQPSKGFYSAIEDIKSTRNFVVYSGERYPITSTIDAVSLSDILEILDSSS